MINKEQDVFSYNLKLIAFMNGLIALGFASRTNSHSWTAVIVRGFELQIGIDSTSAPVLLIPNCT